MFNVICTRESSYHPWPSSVEGSGNSQGLKPTRPGTLHPAGHYILGTPHFAVVRRRPLLPIGWMVVLLSCGDVVLIGVVLSEEERDTCYVGHSIYKLRQHIYKEMITWGNVAEVLSLVMLDDSVV